MPNNIVWSLPTLVENLLKHRITSNSQRLMPIETNYDKDVLKYWLGFVDSASSLVLTSWQVVHHGYPHIYNLHQPETKYEYCLCIRWDSRCPGFLLGTPWSQCLHADFHSFPTYFVLYFSNHDDCECLDEFLVDKVLIQTSHCHCPAATGSAEMYSEMLI